jgi:hypothetical protein
MSEDISIHLMFEDGLCHSVESGAGVTPHVSNQRSYVNHMSKRP